MKFSLSLLLAAALTATVVNANNDFVLYKTSWDEWIWCCQDTDECPDACDVVTPNESSNPNYVKYGPNSTFWLAEVAAAQAQMELDAISNTDAPTYSPAELSNLLNDGVVVAAKCRMIHGFSCGTEGGVFGDPHFKAWNGEFYDYQGQCELKFLEAPSFAGGKGLSIHVRTKIRNNYSYIESAAIRIGEDVLEIGSWGEYFLNGVEGADLPAVMGGVFPIGHFQRSEKQHVFDIFLGGDRRILIKNLKEWVSIRIENPSYEDFETSVGMMGAFPDGTLLARDGITIVEDPNEFGQEWQVQADEPQLFQRNDFVGSGPGRCLLPDPPLPTLAEPTGRFATDTATTTDTVTAFVQRRLGATGVTREQAEEACMHHASHKEFCIQDFLATGDLDVAGAV